MPIPNFFTLRMTDDMAEVARQIFRKRRSDRAIIIKCPFCKAKTREGHEFCCEVLRDTIEYLLKQCPPKSSPTIVN